MRRFDIAVARHVKNELSSSAHCSPERRFGEYRSSEPRLHTASGSWWSSSDHDSRLVVERDYAGTFRRSTLLAEPADELSPRPPWVGRVARVRRQVDSGGGELLGAPHLFACQKVHVITDTLAVGVVGGEDAAAVFVRSLRWHFARTQPSALSIANFLASFHVESQNPSGPGAILVLADQVHGRVRFQTFPTVPAAPGTFAELGEVMAIGSGATTFLDFASRLRTRKTDGGRRGTSDATLEKVIRVNLGLLGTILAIDGFSGAAAAEHWGGGFELIVFDGTAFGKSRR